MAGLVVSESKKDEVFLKWGMSSKWGESLERTR